MEEEIFTFQKQYFEIAHKGHQVLVVRAADVSLALSDNVAVIFDALLPPFTGNLAILPNLSLVLVTFRIEMVLYDKAR